MGSGNEFDIRHAWRIIRRSKLIFCATFVFTFVLTMWASYKPAPPKETPSTFCSTVKVIVTPPGTSDEKSDTAMRRWFASEQLLKQLVLSKELLQRIVTAGELSVTWEDLKDQITLAPVNEGQEWSGLYDSFLIQLDVQANSPEESKKTAEVLVEQLIAYTQEMSAREVIASRRLLEDMLAENKARIEVAQQKIVDWRKKHDVWDVSQLIEAQGEKIAEMQKEIATHQLEIDRLQSEVGLVALFRLGQSESLPLGATNPALVEARSRLEVESNRLAELSKVYLDSNVAVQTQARVVDEVRQEVARQRQLVANSTESQLNGKIAAENRSISQIRRQIDVLKNDERLANSQVELEQLQRQLESLRNNNEDLEVQLNRARVQEEQRRSLGAFTVVEEPQLGTPIFSATSDASRPLREQLLLSSLFSLISAAALTLLYNYHLEHSRLRPQVEEALTQPVLGLVPKLDKKFSRSWSQATGEVKQHFLAYSLPSTPVAEQFRSLVVNIMSQPSPPRRLLITSCWPGDGKSLVCANLAATLTRFNHKVHLVDGDMRRPHLTRTLRQDDSIGLRECLERAIPPEEAFQSTEIQNLMFLPAGKGEANAAELLANQERLKSLFAASEERILLIDSPPLSVCSDAIQLGKAVDGLLLVVNRETWEGEAEKEYLEDLLDHEIPILGVVLNCVKRREMSYGYGDRYKNYYTSQKSG